ncbi:MAG: DNA polymerase III subunit gamma/tau [Chitinophagaceae bacterium]
MEKFIVSARKYRPQTFDTVVGQQHITTTLKNAIRNNHLAHAFLFCGPRGVGKTTCARILAKTINCENQSEEGEACNTCNSCKSFNEGTSLNIHELDAASNNSVDDIRSLVDQVRFAPQAGKYKVYIIDEVHMLSSSAFNAFLKTLEEPPSYAIFILATTEKHKILPTILSRCQIFDFKRITLQDTVTHLQGIAQKEDVNAEEAALQLIAQKSEGCMRDALSILDKIVSFTNGAVNYANAIEHLNILDADYYFKLTDCMLEQDLAGSMLLYDDINKKGFEGDLVLNGLAEFFRNVLICKDDRVASLLEVVESFKKKYTETAKKIDTAYLVSALNILNEAEINFKAARNKRLHVELVLIKLCYLQQALQLTLQETGVEKNKLTDTARSMAFRQITPVVFKPLPGKGKKETEEARPQVSKKITNSEVKLIIDIGKAKPETVEEAKEIYKPVLQPSAKKISSLISMRQQFGTNDCNEVVEEKALELTSLKNAWQGFANILKDGKNPAWQSFELAQLNIIDANSFEALVNNNINQKFLEFERNKACAFLQKNLYNKGLQFSIRIVNELHANISKDVHLSAKEQYQKIIEQYPLVKELRDRLRLELDY